MSEDNSQSPIWVVDTSSILGIKDTILKAKRKAHLGYLTELIESDLVVLHPKVVAELVNIPNPDMYSAWAGKVKTKACRFGTCTEYMQQAMAEKAVSMCIDHLAVIGKMDPADPWVIATALRLRDDLGYPVTVVTDERQNYKKARSSLNIGAGAMGFPAINYETLMRRHSFWDDADLL